MMMMIEDGIYVDNNVDNNTFMNKAMMIVMMMMMMTLVVLAAVNGFIARIHCSVLRFIHRLNSLNYTDKVGCLHATNE